MVSVWRLSILDHVIFQNEYVRSFLLSKLWNGTKHYEPELTNFYDEVASLADLFPLRYLAITHHVWKRHWNANLSINRCWILQIWCSDDKYNEIRKNKIYMFIFQNQKTVSLALKREHGSLTQAPVCLVSTKHRAETLVNYSLVWKFSYT